MMQLNIPHSNFLLFFMAAIH